jgi:peptidoglycan/LPS O-acetylase OafA/YrhL
LEIRRHKIAYLDGLRGIAAFIVFLYHLTAAFYPGIAFNDPSGAHLPHQFESWIALSPFNLLFSGELAVCVFFVLSGYVLTAGFFHRPNRGAAAASFIKRYVRLEIPILCGVLAGWLIIALGLCANISVIPITKSRWLALFFRDEPSLLRALWHAFVNVFVYGTWDYNPVLWTMRVELIGSYLVYSLLLVFGVSRLRFLAYPILIAGLSHTYYALFVVGMLLSSLRPWMAAPGRGLRALGWALFAVGMCLQSYPFGYSAKGSWYEYWGILYGFNDHVYPRLAASIILAAVLLLPRLQAVLSRPIPQYLGRWSFSLYLLHFPIIASWSCWFFLSISPHAPYNAAVLITLLSTTALVLLASAAMTRYVDEPAIRASRLVERSLFNLCRRIFRTFQPPREWQPSGRA